MESHHLFRNITTRVCGTLDIASGLRGAFELLARELPLDELRLNVLDTRAHAIKTVATADHEGARNMLGSPLVMPMPQEVERELRGKTLPDIRTVGRVAEDKASSKVTATHFADVPESSLLLMRLLLDGRVP